MKLHDSQQFRRIISGILIFTLSALLVISVIFIIKYENHHCNEKDCPICSHIESCINNLLNVKNTCFKNNIKNNVEHLKVLYISCNESEYIKLSTLITLKTKMTC